MFQKSELFEFEKGKTGKKQYIMKLLQEDLNSSLEPNTIFG